MSLTRIDKLDKNLIINGAFDYWQRGTSFVDPASIYGCDRFSLRGTDASFGVTFKQSTDLPENTSGYSLELDVTASGAIAAGNLGCQIDQRIEGNIVRDVYGKVVTFAFWVKSSKSGKFAVAFRNHDSTRNYIDSVEILSGEINTWVLKSVVLELESSASWKTDNGIGLRIFIALGTGSDFEAPALKTWTNNPDFQIPDAMTFTEDLDNFKIHGVMLYEGDFEVDRFMYAGRDVFDELRLCKRYFEKSFDIDTTPANGVNTTSLATNGGASVWHGNNASSCGNVIFNSIKRDIPVCTRYGNSSGFWLFNTNTSGGSGFGFHTKTLSGFSVTNQGTTALVNFRGHWTADAEL